MTSYNSRENSEEQTEVNPKDRNLRTHPQGKHGQKARSNMR